jgi:sugar phosphate isomerase/epimerase
MNSIKIAISAQLFGGQLLNREHLIMIKNAGFEVLEMFSAPGHFNWYDKTYISAIAKALKNLNLKVNSVHAPWTPKVDIASLSNAHRRYSVNQVLQAINTLQILHGKILVLHPGSKVSSEKDRHLQISRSLQSIDEITTYCVEHGVALALENPPPDELGGDPTDFRIICDALADDDRIYYCFDTGHAHLTPQGIDLLNDLDKDVLLVHLSDNTGIDDDHLLPPHGTIDWKHFMELLTIRNFKGYLTLELMETPNPALVMQQGMDWLESLTSQKF